MRELTRIVHAANARVAERNGGFLPALALAGMLLSGCSLPVSVPGMSLDDTSTGTIKPTGGSPFSAEMDSEDWRRAKSALDTALDPQGNGAKVAWDNPKSGARGAFTPSAQPFPKDDGICRVFTANVEIQGQGVRNLRSSACKRNGGEWIVGKVVAVSAQANGKPASAENLAERDSPTHFE